MQTKPKKGNGERFFDCPHYESCLDFAALQNWKAFNCEQCGFYIETLQKPPASQDEKVNARICEECNKNRTISPKHSLCASCMAIRSHKTRSGKKKDPVKPKSKKAIHDKAQPEKPQQDHDTSLTIEFGKYDSILREIKKRAEEEVRPIELQVIYILKKYLTKVKT